ncbi:MAG: hypothetical protein M1827_003230 [Pycnora praestabilis]|nr:MAG: hypothetical protein M1827_003230 [Pycnora praestabilis]
MYWPIGAPRVYAAGRHNLSGQSISQSGDGVGLGLDSKINEKDDFSNDGQEQHSPEAEVGNSYESTGSKKAEGLEGNSHEKLTTNGRNQHTSFPDENQAQNCGDDGAIVALRVSRNGYMFATITTTTLIIWQTRPTAVLASVVRSTHSLKIYGPSVSLLLRPDSAIFVVQTSLGYLITYSLATDPSARVYKPQIVSNNLGHSRHQSVSSQRGYSSGERSVGPGEGGGVREVSIRFRMVIKVDAGIVRALALDDELVVATEKPAAVQCIRWTPDSAGSQTSTELLSRMDWISKKTNVVEMVHDRPMNLSTWITSDGKAYAVQRHVANKPNTEPSKSLFRGYCFHSPESEKDSAVKAAINARFSLIAVGCASGDIQVYSVRDYVGNIPLSHKLPLPASSLSTGQISLLTYSPDGYCLFAGFEKGWMMWSVYGNPGGSSFTSDKMLSETHSEGWLSGVSDGSWLGGGSEILLSGQNDDRLWLLEMVRSAVAGCFSSANISRSLLQTNSGFLVYRGYDLPDLTTISAELSLWHHVEIPLSYLVDQWPVRCAVSSPDGSGRWKTFMEPVMQNEFAVRGGMCWYQHILIAAVESGDCYELRLYSRELVLDDSLILHIESLVAPVVLMTLSGEDSLLVYTHENILYHYIITAAAETVRLVQVGQITFNGIVRAPPRVRALSWIIPDDQLRDGDPSRDVAVAAVIFLVDGKLVLLQPSTTESGELKYDMRVIAQNVEYYVLMRDQVTFNLSAYEVESMPSSPSVDGQVSALGRTERLNDSLWLFDGNHMQVWTDVQDVLRSAPVELRRDLPPFVSISVDFYPLSILLNKGIFFGVEPDLVQRRDINFAFFRFAIRTHLFLPQLLRYHISHYNAPAALHLSHHYHHLLYFPHALEILLHDVLDEEVDTAPSSEQALLPSVLAFLSSFPQYLDILVQCTRKTEVRSWRTLFAYLPPPQELFEESLQKGALKTAGGYLLILHTFEELSSSSQQLVRLLRRAKEEGDWELCKELARFLTALDESGESLREALGMLDLKTPVEERESGSIMFEGSRLALPRFKKNGTGSGLGVRSGSSDGSRGSEGRSPRSTGDGSQEDYFSSPID